MKKLKDLMQELGISKVRLAKYLGVSRQMVYNYLEIDDVTKWPKEKKILLLKLLDVKDGDEKSISKIEVTTDYMMSVEDRLNQPGRGENNKGNYLEIKSLDKESQTLLTNIVNIIKEKFLDEKKSKENFYVFTYLYHMLQSMDNVPEIKYIFGYMSKTTGFTKVDEYKFNEDRQFIFEGILYTALNLYNNGGASRSKLTESHHRWEQEIDKKNEEKLGRTQQLNTLKVQALKELGYSKITTENATEVMEKMAEIESRKV